MNLIILAAGMGRRLYPLTKDKPKSLLDIGDGSTLLDKQLAIAAEHSEIEKVYVISGYKVDQIEDKIEQYQHKISSEIIYNPFFDISNNLLSLWCAQHLMLEEDFLVSNGDNIYKPHVYSKLIGENNNGIFILIDKKDHYDEDDMKVQFDEQDVSLISKKISIDHADAESVGFIRVSGKPSRDLFHHKLMSLVRQKNSRNEFWLEIFNGLVKDNISIKAIEIGQHDWGEMDFHPDIDLMKQAIMTKIF